MGAHTGRLSAQVQLVLVFSLTPLSSGLSFQVQIFSFLNC